MVQGSPAFLSNGKWPGNVNIERPTFTICHNKTKKRRSVIGMKKQLLRMQLSPQNFSGTEQQWIKAKNLQGFGSLIPDTWETGFRWGSRVKDLFTIDRRKKKKQKSFWGSASKDEFAEFFGSCWCFLFLYIYVVMLVSWYHNKLFYVVWCCLFWCHIVLQCFAQHTEPTLDVGSFWHWSRSSRSRSNMSIFRYL